MKSKPKFDFRKLFKGKETESEELKEERATKGEKMEKAKKAKPKAKGYKAGGTVRMADGGMDPRMSRGFGPGIAVGMGRSAGNVPGAMMAKGGGVEAKAKGSAKSGSMKKKYI